ncbi:MAG: TetR/AcrR family transcriptional regulator [Lysinibacillus sp.]
MYPLFLKASAEKQRNIINAALHEFSKHSYDAASTNNIVKEAGISKGILFHYFGNKKNLYLYVYEYVLDTYTEAIFDALNLEERDIFKRFTQMVSMQMNLLQQNPAFFNFLNMTTIERSVAVATELEQISNTKQDYSYEKFSFGIDYSLFKEGINVEYALNILRWINEGIAHRYEQQFKDAFNDFDEFNKLLNRCAEEMEDYFRFIKPLLYTE